MHPTTGHLLRSACTSLPFGYSRSPEHFCELNEGVAQLLRVVGPNPLIPNAKTPDYVCMSNCPILFSI